MTFYPLRSYRSDPVLIKPSAVEFAQMWNGSDRVSSPIGSLNEPLGGIKIKITEYEVVDGELSELSPMEKFRQNRRMERRAKRRHSILVANYKETIRADPLHRCSSSPQLTELENPSEGGKRVSFSLQGTAGYPWKIMDEDYKKNHLIVSNKEVPSPSSSSTLPRPILIKKNRNSSLPLTHMDFDSFTAWRRGSRISLEVKLDSTLILEKSRRRRKGASDLRWSRPSDVIKALVLQCLTNRRNRTSPQDISVYVTPAC